MPISGSRDSEINIDGLPDYRMSELAHVEEIEFFSHSRRKAKLSAFSPWQTNAFYSAIYRGFSFNLKKRSFCWYELLISLVFTLCNLWTDVNDEW